MATGVLFSGGKDSCLALHRFGRQNVDVLLSILPENVDSWMFHQPNEKLLKKQAEMLGLQLIIEKSKGKKDEELEDLRKLMEKSKINKLVIGGIRSNYQGERISKICKDLGIELITPLWGYAPDRLWGELLENKFKIVITKISCEGIPKEFIGKIITRKIFERLKKSSEKYKFGMDFEGGEAETAVLYMPGFKKVIKIYFDIKSEDKYRHFLKIKEVK